MTQRSLIGKVWWLIRNRPSHIYGTVRMYLLFYCSRFCRMFIRIPGLVLGKNVRLQRNRSVMAEAPGASISIGEHSVIYEDARIEAYGSGQVEIGAGSIVGDARIVARSKISIGRRFLSSWNVFIQDYDPHPVSPELRRAQVEEMVYKFRPRFDGAAPPKSSGVGDWNYPSEPIVIGDDVWVGAGATILKGAKIGDGCIIAAGAVVLKGEYPSGSLIAGNPATPVKSLGSK